jgi:hypothetical protein
MDVSHVRLTGVAIAPCPRLLQCKHGRTGGRTLDSGLLSPIEEEMRRRGMQADYWSKEHRLLSDLALVERQRRACDAAKHPDRAPRLDNEARKIREELLALRGDREQEGW